MAKKKKNIKVYEYNCTLTGEKFLTNREAPHPNELVSVKGYYELHPEDDDRPEVIKRQVKLAEELQASLTSMAPPSTSPLSPETLELEKKQ